MQVNGDILGILTAEGVLFDTTVWIRIFRGGPSPLQAMVDGIVQGRRAYSTGIVLAELLQGARTSEAMQTVESFIARTNFLETTGDVWRAAGLLSGSLRSKGLTVPLADILITTLSQRHGLSILTLDNHFRQMADHTPLRLHPLPGDYPQGPSPSGLRAAEARRKTPPRSQPKKKRHAGA